MALMTLIKTRPDLGSCRPVEHYYPAPVMIYGTYDDYGGMEDCHGSETEYLLQEFVDNNILDEDVDAHEYSRRGDAGELHFSDIHTFHQTLKGDKNAGIPVQHVAIKMSVLNRFLDQYYFTDYYVKDDNDKEIPINYEYLCNSIPAYIIKLKEYLNSNSKSVFLHHEPVPKIDWKDPDILGRWLEYIRTDVCMDFYRNSFYDHLHKLVEDNNNEGLTNFLKEFCKYLIISSYMNYSRRVYIRPQCSSQETDPKAQKLMAEITLDVIEQQRIEWEKEDFPEDAWDPKHEVFMEQCELDF